MLILEQVLIDNYKNKVQKDIVKMYTICYYKNVFSEKLWTLKIE